VVNLILNAKTLFLLYKGKRRGKGERLLGGITQGLNNTDLRTYKRKMASNSQIRFNPKTTK